MARMIKVLDSSPPTSLATDNFNPITADSKDMFPSFTKTIKITINYHMNIFSGWNGLQFCFAQSKREETITEI